MLPGQLVNVLNVPFALSSTSRSRNASISSTSSEFRTMDPMDKFLNPRPAPAKPPALRLKTSPSLIQRSWSSASPPTSATSLASRRGRSLSSKGSSQPSSANTLRVIRLTKKPSVEERSRSNSRSSNRSGGIIGAFRALKSPRIASPDDFSDRGIPTPIEPTSREDLMATSKFQTTAITEEVDFAYPGPTQGLALRREFHEGADGSAVTMMSSFGHHRRQRSLSRDPSPLHHSLSLQGPAEKRSMDETSLPYQPLETLNEVASTSNTPLWPLTAVKVEGQQVVDENHPPLDLEKRLPTLPNTPSSAYPPSICDEPAECGSYEIENLRSRFSNTTIGTESYTNSYIQNNQSRFSDWTDCTTRASPKSEYESILDFEPMSPPTDAESEFGDNKHNRSDAGLDFDLDRAEHSATKQDGLPSAISFSTVSSDISATPSSRVDLGSVTNARVSRSKFQHYSLPTAESGSGATLKPAPTAEHVTPLVVGDHRTGAFRPPIGAFDESSISHSTSMKELLNELSYLGGMIQRT